jgi:phosphohistidine phosphatase
MRLVLLRHAKSSWDDPGLPDVDRPLAPRGERAADRMGEYLSAEPIAPDLVVCSSALRARQTLARVLPSLGSEVEIRIDPVVYTFDDEVLLERLRRVPADVSTVLLVGHNPAMQELSLRLIDRGERLEDLRQKYPTGALAEIAFTSGRWDALPDAPGELTRFVVPARLRDRP